MKSSERQATQEISNAARFFFDNFFLLFASCSELIAVRHTSSISEGKLCIINIPIYYLRIAGLIINIRSNSVSVSLTCETAAVSYDERRSNFDDVVSCAKAHRKKRRSWKRRNVYVRQTKAINVIYFRRRNLISCMLFLLFSRLSSIYPKML